MTNANMLIMTRNTRMQYSRLHQKHKYCHRNSLRRAVAYKVAYIQYRHQHHIELLVHPSAIIF